MMHPDYAKWSMVGPAPRVQIILRIASLLDEFRVLLLPNRRRLLQIGLGGLAVLLVPDERLERAAQLDRKSVV